MKAEHELAREETDHTRSIDKLPGQKKLENRKFSVLDAIGNTPLVELVNVNRIPV